MYFWPALAAIVAAIASVALPLFIAWYITTHFQQIQSALKQAFTYPGIAVGATVTPLVVGGLVFFGGLTAIGLAFYFGERRIGGPKVRPPELALITAPGFPAQQAVAAAGYAPYPGISYSGGGFTGGAGPFGSYGVARASRPSGGGPAAAARDTYRKVSEAGARNSRQRSSGAKSRSSRPAA
ncbi:MAG TPA: hypothetical protein VMU89_14785 [Thermomicrobiaceae bacterium]|nr:hypothetical protein [Thermomicrobiaceae bacterium]